MKNNIPFPADKIKWFREKLGVEEFEFNRIVNYKVDFIRHKADFSNYFFDYFNKISETAFLLSHQEHGQHLKKIWETWFESFFSEGFNDHFLEALWMSGLRHVEINIDHRFIMLSYSILRQFCQKVLRQTIPHDKQEEILIIIDKMVDFCLMIETNAFVEATSRCDMEVVRGISHQVRNPLTVIGGNAIRLMRNSEDIIGQKNIPEICNTIIEESRRLEKMVTDASAYSDMYQKEVHHSVIPLSFLISRAVERLPDEKKKSLNITTDIFPEGLEIEGDRGDLELMFFYIFQQCLDTNTKENSNIEISAKHEGSESSFVEIKLMSQSAFKDNEELQKSFVPFYSSRPDGTGLGLSIARLAAHKNLGDIVIEGGPDGRAIYIIKLPVPVKDTNS